MVPPACRVWSPHARLEMPSGCQVAVIPDLGALRSVENPSTLQFCQSGSQFG
jgi:hypothetical protein